MDIPTTKLLKVPNSVLYNRDQEEEEKEKRKKRKGKRKEEGKA